MRGSNEQMAPSSPLNYQKSDKSADIVANVTLCVSIVLRSVANHLSPQPILCQAHQTQLSKPAPLIMT
jgi:hypothetical protein